MALAGQEAERIRTAISGAVVKPFLVSLDRSGTRLIVHLATEVARASSSAIIGRRHRLRREFSRRFSAIGLDLPIRIKFYGRSALDRPASLESFVANLGPGERIYDPTGALDKAEGLVTFAKHLRSVLGDDLEAVYWDTRWRTVYTLLNKGAFTDRNRYGLRQDKLIAAERAVMIAHDASDRAAASLSVRLCFDMPTTMQPLVPVDDASFGHGYVQSGHVPRIFQLVKAAKAPILGALLGISSSGMAEAKLPPLVPTSANAGTTAAEPEAGGASRNRNAAIYEDGAPGRLPRRAARQEPVINAVPLARPPSGLQAVIESRGNIAHDHFVEVSSVGETFDVTPAQMRDHGLDLRWLPEREGVDKLNASGRSASNSAPVPYSGIAAILGLSMRPENDMSDEAHRAILKDVVAHFGLPPSLQDAAILYLAGVADLTPAPSRGFFDRKLLMAQGESFFDWLRRAGPNDPGSDRNSPVQTPGRRRAGGSSG
jgi:hypothetical protein